MPTRSTDPRLVTALRGAIDAYRADGGAPGLSLAVTDRRGIVASEVAGDADVAAARPVERSTLFEVGSIGKTFTAAVILQLVDEGRLALDDPVVRHLPWFKVPRTGDRITIHHLLSHTAGITAGVDGTPESTAQVWRLRDLPPGSAPGRRFHYSNVGYKTLGLVIEALEGASYPSVIERRVMRPAGMKDSSPDITDAIRPRMAIGYEPAFLERAWSPGDPIAPATWLTTATADGSVAATGEDMARFVRYLMVEGAELTARMSRPVPAREAFGYGYGLFRLERGGRDYVGHGGGMVGYQAGLQWDPEVGIGAVVLQSCYGGNPLALARQAVRQVVALRDGRDPMSEGAVVDWPDDDAEEPAPPPTPATPDQAPFVGTWRSHQPWTPAFRVEARGDDLWLAFPAAPDGFDDEAPLVPMARGWYRVGEDRLGPERMRFDMVVDGLARRAWLSGWDFYRVDPQP